MKSNEVGELVVALGSGIFLGLGGLACVPAGIQFADVVQAENTYNEFKHVYNKHAAAIAHDDMDAHVVDAAKYGAVGLGLIIPGLLLFPKKEISNKKLRWSYETPTDEDAVSTA